MEIYTWLPRRAGPDQRAAGPRITLYGRWKLKLADAHERRSAEICPEPSRAGAAQPCSMLSECVHTPSAVLRTQRLTVGSLEFSPRQFCARGRGRDKGRGVRPIFNGPTIKKRASFRAPWVAIYFGAARSPRGPHRHSCLLRPRRADAPRESSRPCRYWLAYRRQTLPLP